jgi:hypothetical protein
MQLSSIARCFIFARKACSVAVDVGEYITNVLVVCVGVTCCYLIFCISIGWQALGVHVKSEYWCAWLGQLILLIYQQFNP